GAWWRRYGAAGEEAHSVTLRPGEDRLLQVQLHLADSAGEALRTARPGHDELTKLLWPNMIRRTPALASRPPFTLEERMASKAWIVGTSEPARDTPLAKQAAPGVESVGNLPRPPRMGR